MFFNPKQNEGICNRLWVKPSMLFTDPFVSLKMIPIDTTNNK